MGLTPGHGQPKTCFFFFKSAGYVTINGDLMVNNGELWDDNTNSLLLNIAIEIVDLPINNQQGDFPVRFLYAYQPVNPCGSGNFM